MTKMFEKYLILTFLILGPLFCSAQDTTQFTINNVQTEQMKAFYLENFTLSGATIDGKSYLEFKEGNRNGIGHINLNGEDVVLNFANGKGLYPHDITAKGGLVVTKSSAGEQQMFHVSKVNNGYHRVKNIPLWLSVVPPIVAILLALLFHEVIVSLFIGVWVGAFIIGGMRLDSFYYFFLTIVEVVQTYLVKALNNSGHLSVIIFSLMIGGMVAIISKNGGMAGVVQKLSKYAKDKRSTQFVTWLLGVAIFFDDYANTLIVGNTMRAVTDKFKISREKLAYLVDSTAAPVAAIAFITTWIGAELGYIDAALQGLDGIQDGLTPYAVFLSSLKYSFYPILTLVFMLIMIYTQKDFGKMYQAEYRSQTTGKVSATVVSIDEEEEDTLENLDPVKGAPLKWYNALIPVALVILTTLFGLVDTGMATLRADLIELGRDVSYSWGDIWRQLDATISGEATFMIKVGKVIGSADSYVALLWASFIGVASAVILTVGGKIMTLRKAMDTMTLGFKTMLPALMILVLAWGLADITGHLNTAGFLTGALQDSLNPYLMPPVIFILAALISFSTGSSWSTMAILYPIAIPTTWAICQSQGIDPAISMELLYNVIATVLAASVLGDHCSPISDTTILSSLASNCNHIDHVKTQMPYALTVGAMSLISGTLVTIFGGGFMMSFLFFTLSVGVFIFIFYKYGQKVVVD